MTRFKACWGEWCGGGGGAGRASIRSGDMGVLSVWQRGQSVEVRWRSGQRAHSVMGV